jgi:selenocysteine lyase/cysteine desulfurase
MHYSDDFHDFGGATYLNCAFHGAMPRVASEAVERALELKKTPHLIRDEDHFTYPDAYREAMAEMIGAAKDDVAVTNSATQGTMILVGGLDWREGDEVIVPSGEFPSNLFPWRSLADRGVVVKEVDLSEGALALERIEAAMTPRTRVVSVSWVHYSSGVRLDLVPIGTLCHDNDVLFAIDGSQGIGAIPFDIRTTPVDLIACAGYKWLLAPYGVGFAWVAPGLSEHLAVTNVNWFTLEGSRNFANLSECELTYQPGARRFDVNEPGNFFNMAGAAASAHYLLQVGPENAHVHSQSLLARVVENLPSSMRSLADPDPRYRSNILCLAGSDDATFDRLRAADIYLSRREGSLRVSPHLYNTEADINRLLDALHT